MHTVVANERRPALPTQDASVAQSFLEVARELIDSPEAKTEYAEDPDGFLAARDLEGLTAADLEVAVGFVAEAVPVPTARQLAAASPDAAPDAAALAQLAAATAVEEEVREAEPGSLGLAAVVDPGGELGIPDSADAAIFAPPADDADAAGAEPANAPESDIDGDLPDMEESVIVEPDVRETAGKDETNDPGEEPDDDFGLDPELQPTVDTESASDAGVPAADPAAAAAEVEIPPEETFEDLV